MQGFIEAMVAAAVFLAFENTCFVHCKVYKGTLFHKVANIFYAGFQNCFLETQEIKTAMPTMCTESCRAHPECLLACFHNNNCSLYRANVAPYYDSTNLDPTGSPHVEVPGMCYTSWVYKDDISYLITSVSGTAYASAGLDPFIYGVLSVDKSIDGYHCDATTEMSYYHSVDDFQNPYVCVSFDSYVRVEKLLVKLRRHGSAFHDIEVRVGNFSCTESDCLLTTFQQNELLAPRYESSTDPSDGELVTFDGSASPVVGKHIIVMKMLPTQGLHLIIGDIKVIGKTVS